MATATNTYPTITIDLILDRLSTKDVLRGVLHSILFHRLFGTVKPQTFEVLDITMPGVEDMEMEQLVNEKVDAFWKGIESGSNKRGRITVTFSEKRPKKSWFQVYMGEEEVPWEQWIINAELRQPKSDRDRLAFHTEIATTLTNTVHMMLSHTSSERGRTAVPPITVAAGISPFPISISVSFGGVDVG
ncbi:autophagy-related protein [Collybia nuda]|uniref:Autophagy-related protein 101 n=1 Tax=Collybia nuda TaxID=64659 RepID=A0A9P6CK46_9AGAR|nr:autophagy-related protein [Collybia nuda]